MAQQLTFDKPDPQGSIPARFSYVAQQIPDHPALMEGDTVISYADLYARSCRLAVHLADCFGTESEPVALLLPGIVWNTIGILGVLQSGKFYVSLDPAIQVEALQTTLQISKAGILLTTTDLQNTAEALMRSDVQVVVIDTLNLTHSAIVSPPVLRLNAQNMALVAFTSGSTGLSKGVMWHHGGWLYRAWYGHQHDRISPQDRIAITRSPTFAVYSSHLFLGILNGATLCYCNPNVLKIEDFFSWLNSQAITIFFAGGLQGLPQTASRLPRLSTVRLIPFGGQSTRADDIAALSELISTECVIANRLAMSELPCVADYVIAPRDFRQITDPVPVGYACDGNEIMIWDDNGNVVSPGEPGQIVIRSRYLSLGYWRDPQLTAAKFLSDPDGGDRRIFLTGDRGKMTANGLLYHLGRMDFMVKIRGYRVEPESIETALYAHPAIKEGVVVPFQPPHASEPKLIAYFSTRDSAAPTATELRDFLTQSLPSYMIPARFIQMECLPLTPNGKIDRAALPPPGKERPQLDIPFIAPRTDLEQKLAQIWADLLELDEVGVNDDFFELGGDSLLAMRLTLLVEQRLGWQVQSMFFQSPTISALGNLIKNIDIQTDDTSVHPLNIPQRSNLHPVQPRRSRLPSISVGALLRSAPQKLALRLTYQQGIRWLAWWSNQSLVQERLYNANREMFERFAAAMGTDSVVMRSAFQTALLGDLIRRCYRQVYAQRLPLVWGGPANMLTSPHKFWRSFAELALSTPAERHHDLVVFDGLEYLHSAQVAGRGVILLMYHAAAEFAAISLLERFVVHAPVLRINQNVARKLAEADASDLPASTSDKKSAWSSTLLTQGLHILKSGGVVQIVNDHAHDAANTVPQVIGGRVYAFKTSFAELALETEAVTIPTIICPESNGRLRITCFAPLEPDLNLDRRASILDMVEQYSRFVAYAWRTQPESVGWGMIQRHFDRPVAK